MDLIIFLTGFISGWGFQYYQNHLEKKKFEDYRESAFNDLKEFQKHVHEQLFKANEEFAKIQLGKLLLELLKDIKEKQ